ncbi:BZ3500_MvSof-1268-A1-R1_Chr4-4g07448 [Microbotryum saponariae]|uniref:BZ3500_MvSof-1268-A1-R1_Chr4-4g07448 protein n=1 Tax=Microbotryum saponariae TaxID=289078 RepID=A0A2X0LMB3_9BASI|nr:BZ3500_MvSof-1268-A1-R1_Chr4-4g07448 [Microbotryum saponariae]SDA07109.1 BZ3501_MvSof-1269-A2-R1_Chr4-3g07156 [Microbotryum saponariae]
MERTLLVLFGPQAPLDAIRSLLINHGFRRVAHQSCVGEELEEAGLELGLGTGEANGQGLDDADGATLHEVLVLECENAVRRMKELAGEGSGALNKNALSYTYPDLKLHCSPTVSAAQLTIEALFPNLDAIYTPSPADKTTPIPASPSFGATAASAVNATPKPFALSNAAYQIPERIVKSDTIKLSPRIERALREVDQREALQKQQQHQRAAAGSSLGSMQTATNGFEDSSSEKTSFDGSSASSLASEFQQDELEAETDGPEPEDRFEATSQDGTIEEDCATHEEEVDEADLILQEEGTEEDYEDEVIEAEQQQFDDNADVDHAQVECDFDDAESVIAPESIFDGEYPMSPVSIRSDFGDENSPVRVRREDTTYSLESLTSPSRVFRAQPVASTTHHAPKIQPRMTKAAALRLGIELPAPAPRASLVADLSTPQPARVVEMPKSLGAPSITPRATKSSVLRVGSTSLSGRPSLGASFVAPTSIRREAVGTAERAAMSRRESLSAQPTVASLINKPKFEVRLSKTAALRTGVVPAPPSTPGSTARRRSNLVSSPESPSTSRDRAIVILEDLQEEAGAIKRPASSLGGDRPRPSVSVSSTAPPKIVPRMSKTAALRTGVDLAPVPRRDRSSSVVSDDSRLGDGGLGHKRRQSVAVASTARPAIEPKMTKAARLRAGLGIEPSPSAMRRQSMSSSDHVGLLGPPRRQSIVVPAVVRAPSITPRLNRSAMLRANPDGAMSPIRPRSSLGISGMPRPGSSLSNTSSLARSGHKSSTAMSGVRMACAQSPIIAPRMDKSAALRASSQSQRSPPRGENVNRAGWNSTPKTVARHVPSRPSTVMSFVNDGKRALSEMNAF